MVLCFWYFQVVELFMCFMVMLLFDVEFIENLVKIVCFGNMYVECISVMLIFLVMIEIYDFSYCFVIFIFLECKVLWLLGKGWGIN